MVEVIEQKHVGVDLSGSGVKAQVYFLFEGPGVGSIGSVCAMAKSIGSPEDWESCRILEGTDDLLNENDELDLGRENYSDTWPQLFRPTYHDEAQRAVERLGYQWRETAKMAEVGTMEYCVSVVKGGTDVWDGEECQARTWGWGSRDECWKRAVEHVECADEGENEPEWRRQLRGV